MKFKTLKLFDYPSINEEVIHVTLLFKQLAENIENSNNNNKEAAHQFVSLQNDVMQRVQDLKQFIQRFSFDSRISNFIKIQKNLVRLLTNYNYNIPISGEVESNSRRNFPTNQTNNTQYTNNKTNNNRAQSAITREHDNTRYEKRRGSDKNISGIVSSNMNNLNETKYTNHNVDTSNIKLQNKPVQEKSYFKNESSEFKNKINPKFGVKLDQLENYEDNHNIGNLGNINSNDITKNNIKQNINRFDIIENQWKEIVFKIKLSPDEYELLINEKTTKRNTFQTQQQQTGQGNNYNTSKFK
jgi:hypothetical protein